MKCILFGLVAALALTSAVQAQHCSPSGYQYRPAPVHVRPVNYNYGHQQCQPGYHQEYRAQYPGYPQKPAPVGVAQGDYPLLECYVSLKNDYDYPQEVYLQYYTQHEGRFTWFGEPGTEKAFKVTIPGRKTLTLAMGGRKITASRIRVWANGWNEYQAKDYFLVNDKDENGHRRYFAPSIVTHTVLLGAGQPVPNGNAQVVTPGPISQPVQPVQPVQPAPVNNNGGLSGVAQPGQGQEINQDRTAPVQPQQAQTQRQQTTPAQTTPAQTTPAQTTQPVRPTPQPSGDGIIIDPDRQMPRLIDE